MKASDRINYLNVALMLVSCTIALFIPFELFLFAYAVLGPAHYLTEISWLQNRGFFLRGRFDFWLLAALAILVLWTAAPPAAQTYTIATALITAIAFGCALVLVLTDKAGSRVLWLAAVTAVMVALVYMFGFVAALMALFVPTLIHVYVFTGFFMIYGALKERSWSGYLAFAVFLLCPLACRFVDPAQFDLSGYVVVSYWKSFSLLNLTILGIPVPHTKADGGAAGLAVFSSPTGLMVMRFIAFAYTYHYLNWFSKTSIIKWHETGKKRLAVIAVLWLTSLGIYIYDYSIGVRLLLYLSLLHVFLEFPLNHISIMGTVKEVRLRFSPPAPTPVMAASAGRTRAG